MSYSFYNKKENRQVAGNEVTINDFTPTVELAKTSSRLDGSDNLDKKQIGQGGEGLIEDSLVGGSSFSETTASFSVDAVIGSIDYDTTTEATTLYQYSRFNN